MVRVEANRLLYFTLELLVHPNSPASDWLDGSGQSHPHDGKRVLLEFARRLLHADAPFHATSDSLGACAWWPTRTRNRQCIADFNDALKSARRRATMDDEDVKYFIDNEKKERSADADLLEIIMNLRKQVRDTATHVKTLSNRVNGKGFARLQTQTNACKICSQ
ncbi:hypothetical protein CYMTET_8398 [Cymbomonas tetramitiformis]|uniref:Uncharacterized protein n=1 Tax=Cymbomonas tetramitiformis TaxID=36881 RepID=A0AAE0LGJ0_9CHLO|nr:hypothetical protein CYMTET_8398 [Cymbomonas tetramitiformis]